MSLLRKYGVNLALALDEFFNATAGGSPKETLSSRAAKARLKGQKWAYYLCSFLNIFQKGHCVKAKDDTVGSEGVFPD
jgi:hypothetical protein